MENLYPHPPPHSHSNQGCKNGQFWLLRGFILDLGGGGLFVACEQQTHFRSSLLSLLAEAREATTANASAVRRQVRRLGGLLFRFILSKIGSRVPVSQRLIFTPSPPKNPKVTPSWNVCFTFFFFIFCFLRHRFSIASCQFAGYIHFECGWTVLDQEFENNDLVWRHILRLTPGRRLPW